MIESHFPRKWHFSSQRGAQSVGTLGDGHGLGVVTVVIVVVIGVVLVVVGWTVAGKIQAKRFSHNQYK